MATDHGNEYAVFLRGVNVNGVRIAMGDLREALAGAGFRDVRTLLASGNVVLAADSGAAQVKARVEEVLRKRFAYDAWAVVKTPDQVAAIVAGYPFVPADDGVDRHAYAVLATGPDVVGDLSDGLDPSPAERWRAAGDVLFWEVRKGSSLETNLARRLGKPKYKPLATTRNLTTMRKVLAAFRGPAGVG